MMKKAVRHVILTVICLISVFPFLWMIVSSLKTKEEVMQMGQFLPQTPQWGNYLEIIFHSPIPHYLFNSLFVACCVVALQVGTGALFAYAVTFMRFRGRNLLFGIVLATYMVPTAATYIPCYKMLAQMGLLDTYRGLIFSNCVGVFGIFLLRQAFRQLPESAIEAARIDGAGHLQILLQVVMPMTRSSFTTFILLGFIGTYNSYMWPSLITDSPQLSLVSQGLRRYLYEGGAYGTQWSLVMAAGTVVVVPLLILFLATRKQIMDGIADTGSKG